MATTQSILFSWDNVEALPDLHRLELVFHYLPGQDIIAALQQMRGQLIKALALSITTFEVRRRCRYGSVWRWRL